VLEEVLLDVEIVRGLHVNARVAMPDNTRGVVACVNEDASLAAACSARGFATVQVDVDVVAETIDTSAAVFADVVQAVAADRAIFDRPVGYFGAGLGGAAALIAASLRMDSVASVVALNTPVELTGTHLSGVRAATLFLVEDKDQVAATAADVPALPSGSMLIQDVGEGGAAAASVAAEWFDRTLRGVMRGARRELWRSA
jgi:pimeloyl-ACP methyl ester carboxylesterase